MKTVKRTLRSAAAVLLTLMFLALGTTAGFAAAEPAALQKKDGSYTVKLELKGGDVTASVKEPVFLRVENLQGFATIEWENVAYDALIVGGETFAPVSDEKNTVFEIPVTAYDEIVKVTAVKDGKETEYGMTFSSSGIHKVRTAKDYLIVVAGLFAVFAIALAVSIRRLKQQ